MGIFLFLRGLADFSSKVFFIGGMASTLFIAVAVFYNVVLRYLFKNPTYWSTEISSAMLVVLTFLGAGEVLRVDGHIKFSLILDRLSGRRRSLFEATNSMLGFVFSVVLFWQAARATHMVYINDMRMPSLLGLPLAIPYFFISLGSLMLALQFLIRLVVNVHHFSERNGRDGT